MEEQKLLKKKSKTAGNNTALVSACTDLASHYSSVGQYSKAIQEYEIAAKIHKDETRTILYAQTHRGIGEAYMGLHNFHKTLRHFKIYYEVAVQEHNIVEQQRALAQLGHLYLTWYLETFSEDNKQLLTEAYGYFVRSMRKCEILQDTSEKQDMLARLFSNLGLVKENLGEYDTALNLYEKSIKLCLAHDIYEQLYRGYLSMASLHEKQDKYHETVKNYNLAIEIAKKLSSRRLELICAALLAKSQALIKIGDFQGAKQVLRKAYKFKTPLREDKDVIERHLRVVASMCKIEDDIITCNDQKQLKTLYEKMGDGACDLKNFPKAIEYYKKMLEAAERTGVSDKELGECYYSLAETYKDIGNFKEAESYFEKEYDLCKDKLKDSLNTLCKIIDVKETANGSVDDIKTLYERGLVKCRKKRNAKEEKRLVVRYINFLKRSLRHTEAFKMEQHLNNLQERTANDDEGDNSSSSEYESEDSAKVHIGFDIVLSDVTDVSEASDDEVPAVQPSKRRKQSTVKFKKNLNGEWPLHLACIKGNRKMVQYWLDVDHPVNVRDNAGWLPIHEATLHGHLDIVGLLLDHKASINDRGGSECNGITPLHDAASNGHLQVVELLLDRGASALAKTDDGKTPLFELKRWHSKADGDSLSGESLSLYNKLIKRLEDALDKAGQKDSERDNVIDSPGKENVCGGNANVGKLRRNIYLQETPEEDFEDDLETLESFDNVSQASEKSASNEYQQVMQTLRHKNYSTKKSPASKPSTSKRSALIDAGDFVDADDWLQDDIGPAKIKKRKTNSGESLFSGGGSSKSPMISDDFDQDCFDYVSNQRRDSNSSNDSNRSSLARRRTQVTLLDSGFSRERSGRNSNKLTLRRTDSFQNDQTSRPSQAKITNYGAQIHSVVEADSTTITRSPFRPAEATQSVIDPTLFVDVEIEGRAFRVPVLLSQVQVKTIKWLAEEAAHRYESKEYMKPVLELETTSGVILANSDLLSLLFPMGGMQAEKVVGKVTEWSLPSVMERYRETCANMGADVDSDLCNLIQTISINLDISNRGLLGNDLGPLLKALNNQKSLTEINLSGNFLNVQGMAALCATLATLPNLQTLNLSATGLRRSYLSQLAGTLAASGGALNKLCNLDLSDNILLKTDSCEDLSVITHQLSLARLNLSNTGLAHLTAFQAVLCLKSLEHLDISYNALNDEDIKRIVSWLDGRVVKRLNLSRNATRRALRQVLEGFEGDSVIVLQEIHLEECGVNDSDIFELLRLAPNLASIHLCYNPDLTSISLRRLLECGHLRHIHVTNCDNIWTYFDPNETGWSAELRTHEGKATFQISGGCAAFYDRLGEMFRVKYPTGLEMERQCDRMSVVVDFGR